MGVELGFAEFFGILGIRMITFLAIVIPLSLIQLTLLLVAIISILRKTNAPTNEKILWLCVAFFISTIGPILYFAIGQKQLERHNNPDNVDEWAKGDNM
ncbi:MAG: PLD nuclease N-terminal domain-containing protein [Defluviitaleaceae bacterium]|nr:PLD nuclease N-terminal domain-containing protein [Defluviitaleaceae bacterium]